MTPAQTRRLYFPAWTACYRATWRREPSGRIVPVSGAPESDVRAMVEGHASTFAEREARGVTESDLRHAATAIALQHAREYRTGKGQPLPSNAEAASSRHLDGLGLDMFRALCALIADPMWLGPSDMSGDPEPPGMIWWMNPDLAEGHRMLRVLDTRTTPGYASGLSSSLFGTRDYHDLDIERLERLYRLMLSRQNAWHPREVRRLDVESEDAVEVGR